MSKIYYANLVLQDRSKRKIKTYTVNKCVYTPRADKMLKWGRRRDRRIINRVGAKTDLYIAHVDVIKVVGKSNVY